MDSLNSFDKHKAAQAAKRVLQEINGEREQIKATACRGHRAFRWFGRELTVEEVWARASWKIHALISFHRSRQEMIAERILAVAEHCSSDTIILSTEDFWAIKDQW